MDYKKTVGCTHCGYQWEARTEKPKSCPNCKRRDVVVKLKKLEPGSGNKRFSPTNIVAPIFEFNTEDMKKLKSYAKKNNIPLVKNVPYKIVFEWLKGYKEASHG